MQDFQLWREANTPGGFKHHFNGLINALKGGNQQPQAPDPAEIEKQRQLAERNDPATRQRKSNLLYDAFMGALTQEVKLRSQLPIVQRAVSNIAKSFTLGYRIQAADFHQILLAIHRSKGVNPMVKTERFSDHFRLMNFFKQVFEHHPETWYNPQATDPHERFAPNAVVNQDDFEIHHDAWNNSPHNYKNKPEPGEANAPNSPTGVSPGKQTVVQEVIEMFKSGNANVSFGALKTIAQTLYKKAIENGVQVELGDLNDLKTIANQY